MDITTFSITLLLTGFLLGNSLVFLTFIIIKKREKVRDMKLTEEIEGILNTDDDLVKRLDNIVQLCRDTKGMASYAIYAFAEFLRKPIIPVKKEK